MIEKEVDFRDYVLLFLKYKYLVAGIVMICLCFGFVFYKLEVPYYSSTATLIMDTESLNTKYTVTNVQSIDTLREVAYSYETILQAVVDLDLVNVNRKVTFVLYSYVGTFCTNLVALDQFESSVDNRGITIGTALDLDY